MVRTLTVKTSAWPGQSYEVRVGRGLLAAGGATDGLNASAVLVVVDAGVPRSLLEPMLKRLDGGGVRWGVGVVSAEESVKSLATVERLLADAAELRLERSGGLVVGVGGGIVTDLAGLVAGLYRRGVRSALCPTTLLAMVDGATGGKTAANLTVKDGRGRPRLLKNFAGVFHQPSRVVCDTEALRSLPDRELRAGLAECLKHGLIGGVAGDATLWDWTLKKLDDVLERKPATLTELIARNVALKARVVGKDERELSTRPDGGRMMLNLGHTFAHALEPLSGLSWRSPDGTLQAGHLKHGEAVGLGLMASAFVARALGLCERDLPEQVTATLLRAGLPAAVTGLPPAATLMDHMLDDKKTAGGVLRLILPIKGRRCRVVENPPRAAVEGALAALRTA
ncbi:MAG: 3-dehydroquinate synthase [Planctomycetaceae bacterium]|jgi:3-dehydroquinate synthetase|nr:3-dehydroquinate synthase [Phycisphaerales bacterium]MCE2652915.1 3-dehydroquinate synthase [Planctomycetaceae bacterium]